MGFFQWQALKDKTREKWNKLHEKEVTIKSTYSTYYRTCKEDTKTRQFLGAEDKRGTNGSKLPENGGYREKIRARFFY